MGWCVIEPVRTFRVTLDARIQTWREAAAAALDGCVVTHDISDQKWVEYAVDLNRVIMRVVFFVGWSSVGHRCAGRAALGRSIPSARRPWRAGWLQVEGRQTLPWADSGDPRPRCQGPQAVFHPGMNEQNWELLMTVFDWNVVTLEDCLCCRVCGRRSSDTLCGLTPS